MFEFFKSKIINWCIEKQSITIENLHTSLSPVSCEINDVNNNLKFIEQSHAKDIFVQTPSGYSKIKHSFKTVKYQIWEIELEDGKKLKAADKHILINKNNEEIFIENLAIGNEIKTIDGYSKVKSIFISNELDNMFDLELDDDNHVFYTNGILSHNTTTAAIYILWLASFHEDKFCVIASKNMSHATDIMAKIKFAYEELPHWLKPGCKFYNRTSVEFDNGSLIRSEATTEKTGRGNSPSILFLDEIAFISRRIQETIWASIAPSLSTGGKLILSTTPNGDTDLFSKLWRESIAGINNFGHVMKLYNEHPERGPDSGYREEMLAKLGDLKVRVELDCEFLSSDALLINSLRLAELRHTPPMLEDQGFRVWSGLNPECIYMVGVDIATGSGKDFSVIQVFEFPTLIQIAEYRSNSTIIPELYTKIKWLLNKLTSPIGNKRPEVFWSFERNSCGEGIGAMYYSDENPPEFAELVNDDNKKLGMYTQNRSKVLACLDLKNLVEKIKNGLVINSDMLIFELKNYVSTGGSYAAKPGATDDLVAATLIVLRILKHIGQFEDKARQIMYSYDKSDYVNENEVSADESDEPLPFLI